MSINKLVSKHVFMIFLFACLGSVVALAVNQTVTVTPTENVEAMTSNILTTVTSMTTEEVLTSNIMTTTVTAEPTNLQAVENAPKKEWKIKAHVFLMFIGWVVSPMAAVLVSRFGGTRNWHRVHFVLIAVVTVGCTVLGMLIILSVSSESKSTLFSFHWSMGWMIVLLLVFLCGIGLKMDDRLEKNEMELTWHTIVHSYIGMFVVVLGLVNSFLGLLMYANLGFTAYNYHVYFWSFIGLYSLILTIGEIKRRKLQYRILA